MDAGRADRCGVMTSPGQGAPGTRRLDNRRRCDQLAMGGRMSKPIQIVERFSFTAHGGSRAARVAAQARVRELVVRGYVVALSSDFDGSLGDLWLLRAFQRNALPFAAPNVGRIHPRDLDGEVTQA